MNRIIPPRTRDIKEIERWQTEEAAEQDDSTATTVALLVVDFNALLAKLRTAKLLDE